MFTQYDLTKSNIGTKHLKKIYSLSAINSNRIILHRKYTTLCLRTIIQTYSTQTAIQKLLYRTDFVSPF